MKKLILFLAILLTSVSYSQIVSYGDTSDLKKSVRGDIVLLNQYGGGDMTGGGFFYLADSTYDEGTYAFDSYYPGKQWVRLGTFGPITASTIAASSTLAVTGVTTLSNAIDGTAYIAGIDSFWVTEEVDTIAISGVAVGNMFTFAEYCPDYDTDADTVVYSYICKTDTVFVTRSTAADLDNPTYKSAGKYSYIRIK